MADNKAHNPDRHAEQWLDAALRVRMDATAEPRPGLEERVLARLATAPKRKPMYWWPLAFIGVAAAVLIAAAMLIVRPRTPEKPSAAQTAQPVVSRPAQVVASKPPVGVRKPEHGNQRQALVAANRSPLVRQKEVTPKLATFPVKTPETDQERMLARLAARRGAFELASASSDQAIKELQVKELALEPMEGTPPDIQR